jgi:hypothetical protein
MIRILFSIFALILCTPVAMASNRGGPFPGADCNGDLLSRQQSRLGIGVLVEGRNGVKYLGVSPYAGSLHSAILTQINKRLSIKQILWMGELRFHVAGGGPVLVEANETSGHFKELRNSGFEARGRKVPLHNSVENLPGSVRSTEFKGYAFDVNNMRLAPELQKVQADVRHSIGTSLQAVATITLILAMDFTSAEDKQKYLRDFHQKNREDVILVNWLIRNLIEDQRLSNADSAFLLNLMSAFQRDLPLVEEIAATDQIALDTVMQKLTAIVNPDPDEATVELLRLP